MAKATNRKKTQKEKRSPDWSAGPNNAIELAALRWYSLGVEQRAIEIYATRPARFADLSRLLRKQLRELDAFADRLALTSDDCPPGYELCPNGICAPMCDGEVG